MTKLQKLIILDELFKQYVTQVTNNTQEKQTMTAEQHNEAKLQINLIEEQMEYWSKTNINILELLKHNYKGDANTIGAVYQIISQIIQERINQLSKIKDQLIQILNNNQKLNNNLQIK